MWLGFRKEVRALKTATGCIMAAALSLASGCGSDSNYANEPRPPAPISVSAAISPDKISVSPARFGAGPVTFQIANLTDDTQQVTVETRDLSNTAGIRQTSSVINPEGTATLKLDIKRGSYVVSVKQQSIQEARVKVGKRRKSSQDELLQP